MGYCAFTTKSDLPCYDDVAGRTLATVRGDLELHRVRFAYPARIEAPVFKDFSLQVPQQGTHFPALSKHSPGFHRAACMRATRQGFSLQPLTELACDVSLARRVQVLPGKSLALVGASGSGKCAPPHC